MADNNYNPYTGGSDYNYSNTTNRNSVNYEYDNFVNSGQTRYNTEQSHLDRQLRTSKILSLSFVYMVAALIISGLVAVLTYNSGMALDLLSGAGFYVILVIEVIVAAASGSTLKKNDVFLTGTMFAIYSICTGMTMSILFFAFDAGSLATIFFAAAAMFAAIAVFAMVTKKDLTVVGILGYMGIFAILIVGIISIIFGGTLSPLMLAIGLAIFIGVTAYDIQKMKERVANSVLSDSVVAMYCAFSLYLDFVNIFLKLVRLFGKSRD